MIIFRVIRFFSKILFKIDFFILRWKFKKIGKKVIVEGGYYCGVSNFLLGDYVYIGPGANINANGGLTILDGTIIGPNVTILTVNHDWKKCDSLPYSDGDVKKTVFIGRGVWIGEGVKIVPGIHIGDGAIIGMGSVVTSNIPEFSVAIGNPANVVYKRKNIDTLKTHLITNNFYIKNKYEK